MNWKLKILGVCGAMILFLNALTSHISASEFWPMTLSKEIFHLPTPEIGLYFKPTFHLLLALPHLFPLENVEHILASRSLFAGVAVGIFFLLFKLLQKIADGSPNRPALLFLLILFLSPVFFTQIIKVRSDVLSLLGSLALIFVAVSRPPPWKQGRFLAIVLLHYALLGATPRALFHDLVALSFILAFQGRRFLNRDSFVQFSILFVAPLLSLWIPLSGGLGAHLFRYFQDSFQESGNDWGYLVASAKQEIFLSALLLFSGAWLTFQKKSPDRYLLIPTLMAAVVFVLSDIKTPYLLASLLPFLMLPVFAFLKTLESPKLILAFFGFLLLSHGINTSRTDWWSSNSQQLQVIQKLTEVLKDRPDATYFDGLGLLPRTPQILAYLGPSDEVTLGSAASKVAAQKPEFILYTSRAFLLGQNFVDFLLANYREIGPDLYLRKDLPLDLKIDFSAPPVLIFRTMPFEFN